MASSEEYQQLKSAYDAIKGSSDAIMIELQHLKTQQTYTVECLKKMVIYMGKVNEKNTKRLKDIYSKVVDDDPEVIQERASDFSDASCEDVEFSDQEDVEGDDENTFQDMDAQGNDADIEESSSCADKGKEPLFPRTHGGRRPSTNGYPNTRSKHVYGSNKNTRSFTQRYNKARIPHTQPVASGISPTSDGLVTPVVVTQPQGGKIITGNLFQSRSRGRQPSPQQTSVASTVQTVPTSTVGTSSTVTNNNNGETALQTAEHLAEIERNRINFEQKRRKMEQAYAEKMREEARNPPGTGRGYSNNGYPNKRGKYDDDNEDESGFRNRSGGYRERSF